MDEVKYLKDKEVAKLIGRGLPTLRNDRSQGRGIPFCRIGRSIRYKLADVVQYMDSHRVDTSAGASQAKKAIV